jgi:hypothetical protein
MRKPYNIILILVLIMNIIMGIALLQQSAKLTEYERHIATLENRVEDLKDAVMVDVIPKLEKILKE